MKSANEKLKLKKFLYKKCIFEGCGKK